MNLYKLNWLGLLLLLPVQLLFAKDINQLQLECFVSNYPQSKIINDKQIAVGQTIFNWQDNKNKSFKQMLDAPSLKDTLSVPYSKGESVSTNPAYNHDSGRFRNQKFLKSIYGQNRKAIRNNLERVAWVKKSNGRSTYILFNKNNNASNALRKVVSDLSKLPARYNKYLNPIGGTFNYRVIAGTNRLSPHSYGIAIDINTSKSNYWRYVKSNLKNNKIKFKNRIPQEIVDIFEKHGFVWGGRWYHYDTMHFEYRPEIISCTNLLK